MKEVAKVFESTRIPRESGQVTRATEVRVTRVVRNERSCYEVDDGVEDVEGKKTAEE